MTSHDFPAPGIVATIQWAPTRRLLDGQPGPMLQFLATGTKTHGYGGGPGAAMTFGTEHGGLDILPGQWVAKHRDGTFTVHDEDPAPAPGAPTKESIRWAYCAESVRVHGGHHTDYEPAFDTWFEDLKARIAAQAVRDAAKALWGADWAGPMIPGATEAARRLGALADSIKPAEEADGE